MIKMNIHSLLARIPVFNGYPSKHPKKQKEQLKYFHVSNYFVERMNPETGVV